MKLLLHVGLHRAASTSLQNWLRGRQAQWHERGCLVVPGVSGPGAASPFATLAGDLLQQAGASAGDYIAAEMDGLAAKFSRGIVSDENFLGPMPGASYPVFSALAPLCEAVGQMASGHEIVPLVILRQHAAWLKSLYDTQRLRGEHRPFSAFVAQTAADLAFAPLLEALAAASGSRTQVYWLEDIAADGGASLMAGIAATLQIPPAVERRFPASNAAQPALVLRLASAFGRRRAMLAEAGSPWFAEAVRKAEVTENTEEQLVALTAPRAIRFPFTLSPGQRASRAIALYRRGVPPNRLLPRDACRAAVHEALQPLPLSAGEPPAELRARFQGDMDTLRAKGCGPRTY